MGFDEYAETALRTLTAGQREAALNLGALGLGGEAGEVIDIVKKWMFHGRPLDLESLKHELGDVLWYVALLAHGAGVQLSEVAQGNLDKQALRFPDGKFTPEAAEAKADVERPA